MSDLIIGEPDVIRKEDNILWLRAEIERLRARVDELEKDEACLAATAVDTFEKRIAELESAINEQASRLMTVQRGEKMAHYELRLDVADKLLTVKEALQGDSDE